MQRLSPPNAKLQNGFCEAWNTVCHRVSGTSVCIGVEIQVAAKRSEVDQELMANLLALNHARANKPSSAADIELQPAEKSRRLEEQASGNFSALPIRALRRSASKPRIKIFSRRKSRPRRGPRFWRCAPRRPGAQRASLYVERLALCAIAVGLRVL
jgi:hypothetical protein